MGVLYDSVYSLAAAEKSASTSARNLMKRGVWKHLVTSRKVVDNIHGGH